MSLSPLKIGCLIVNHDCTMAKDGGFVINVPSGGLICELDDTIRRTLRNTGFFNLDGIEFTLWALKPPFYSLDQDLLLQFLASLKLDLDQPDSRVLLLNRADLPMVGARVDDQFEDLRPGYLHLLVQISSSFTGSRHNISPSLSLASTTHLNHQDKRSRSSESGSPRSKRWRVDLYHGTGTALVITQLGPNEAQRKNEIAWLLYDNLWGKPDRWSEIAREITRKDLKIPAGYNTSESFEESFETSFVSLRTLLSWDDTKDPLGRMLEPDLIVRKEYKDAESYMDTTSFVNRKLKNIRPNILIVGHPGIGKTVSLTYFLLRRLMQGLPTIFSSSQDAFFLFLASGVFRIYGRWSTNQQYPDLLKCPPNGLILFDIDDQVCPTNLPEEWRVLATSSPNPKHYKQWVKTRPVKNFWMKSWTWTEIYCVWQYSPGNKCDLKDLETRFIKYGGSARSVLDSDTMDLEDQIDWAIRNCTCCFDSLLYPRDEISHSLIVTNPHIADNGEIVRDQFDAQISTRYLFQRLLLAKEAKLIDGLQSAYEALFRKQGTKPGARILFEAAAHRYLFARFKPGALHVRELTADGPTSPPSMLGLTSIAQYKTFSSITSNCYGFDKTKYHIPTSQTNPGIGSFAIEEDKKNQATNVVAFQFVVSLDHPINPTCFAELWPEDATVKDTTNWKLVFVVPEDIVDEFRAQRWESDQDLWNERVKQFVLGVNMDELWDEMSKPSLLKPSSDML